jgi:hypothetical protein
MSSRYVTAHWTDAPIAKPPLGLVENVGCTPVITGATVGGAIGVL